MVKKKTDGNVTATYSMIGNRLVQYTKGEQTAIAGFARKKDFDYDIACRLAKSIMEARNEQTL